MLISHGNVDDDHVGLLRDLAKSGESATWTVVKDAEDNEEVLVYIKAPIQALVSVGRVTGGHPSKPSDGWTNFYMTRVSDFRMLEPFISLDDLRLWFPDWRWLKTPQSHVRVPLEYEPRLAAEVAQRVRNQ